jgi:hypothetical protein
VLATVGSRINGSTVPGVPSLPGNDVRIDYYSQRNDFYMPVALTSPKGCPHAAPYSLLEAVLLLKFCSLVVYPRGLFGGLPAVGGTLSPPPSEPLFHNRVIYKVK